MCRRIGLFALLWLLCAGCHTQQARLQMAEESEREKDLDVRTLGDVTEIGNAVSQQVHGIGLVTGLDGTGGSPAGQFRQFLELQLRKQKVDNVKALLDSPNNALVLVAALIPAGARQGDPLDLQITLPPGSKATSLVGGYLQHCSLRTYESTKNLNPEYEGKNSILQGHVMAYGKGPLLVGFGTPADQAEVKRAVIWQGGVSLVDRPYYFLMRNDDKSLRIANHVAERINFSFQEDQRRLRLSDQQKKFLLMENVAGQLNTKAETGGMTRGEMARARDKETIAVRVPYIYRFNHERYLRVARLTPIRAETGETMQRYRQRLERMLAEPQDTLRAALRLEALGKDSVPILKQGLTSDHPLVRFACAEAMAYLGSVVGADELAQLARDYPVLANFALTALASLDEGVCRAKLTELLTTNDMPLRCAAYMALRLCDPDPHGMQADSRPHGELLNDAFWLDRVAPRGEKFVSFAIAKRAEIVLYGADIRLQTPVSVLVGRDYTVTAAPNDDRCTVSHITAHSHQRKQCSLQLDDVLRTLADLGAGYTEAVDFLRKIEEFGIVNAPVRPNLVPPEVSVEQLVELARDPSAWRPATLQVGAK